MHSDQKNKMSAMQPFWIFNNMGYHFNEKGVLCATPHGTVMKLHTWIGLVLFWIASKYKSELDIIGDDNPGADLIMLDIARQEEELDKLVAENDVVVRWIFLYYHMMSLSGEYFYIVTWRRCRVIFILSYIKTNSRKVTIFCISTLTHGSWELVYQTYFMVVLWVGFVLFCIKWFFCLYENDKLCHMLMQIKVY